MSTALCLRIRCGLYCDESRKRSDSSNARALGHAAPPLLVGDTAACVGRVPVKTRCRSDVAVARIGAIRSQSSSCSHTCAHADADMARQRHIQQALGHTTPIRPADWLCMIAVCSDTTVVAVAGSGSPSLSTDSMIHRVRQHTSPALGGSTWQQPFRNCTSDTATDRLMIPMTC